MKTVLKIAAGLVGLLVLALAGAMSWATVVADHALSELHDRHRVDIPLPWPLSPEELATMTWDVADSESAIAMERAIARGEHLLTARYGCGDCHGADLGGGTMVDDPALGSFFGPNLTQGEGSATRDYTMTQWDHIVRHGVKSEGSAAVMPSVDYLRMSDQELSDLVAAIRARPAVDRTMPASTLGPLGRVLMATGDLPLAARHPRSQAESHAALPPPALATVEFGEHLAGTCTGCHGPALTGGPIPGGDPSWPPATNITRQSDGLQSWQSSDFERFVHTSQRPDGTEVAEPMTSMMPLLQNMTDTEREALWAYLGAIPRTMASAH